LLTAPRSGPAVSKGNRVCRPARIFRVATTRATAPLPNRSPAACRSRRRQNIHHRGPNCRDAAERAGRGLHGSLKQPDGVVGSDNDGARRVHLGRPPRSARRLVATPCNRGQAPKSFGHGRAGIAMPQFIQHHEHVPTADECSSALSGKSWLSLQSQRGATVDRHSYG